MESALKASINPSVASIVQSAITPAIFTVVVSGGGGTPPPAPTTISVTGIPITIYSSPITIFGF